MRRNHTLAMMSSELKEAFAVTTRGAVLTTALRARRARCDAAAGQVTTDRRNTGACHWTAMHRPEALCTRWHINVFKARSEWRLAPGGTNENAYDANDIDDGVNGSAHTSTRSPPVRPPRKVRSEAGMARAPRLRQG